ncbi:MAG: ammonium transporter [Verrucomicrobiaceae bacterium]|nr:MAG: ammonium transporter [Verrucomicrobiaceae bacterium]
MKISLPFHARILAAFFLTAVSTGSVSAVETHSAASIEQRLSAVEAYFSNTDPSTSLRKSDGTIPQGLTTPAVGVPGPGHNTWMMVSSALVLFMTLPGLAIFYGGLVRRKNVLSVLAQCLGTTTMVAVIWWAVGYSLAFAHGSPFLGGLDFAFLRGVDAKPNPEYSSWVSQNVFSMFQMMFAIITPALIIGAVAERMRFQAILAFLGIWLFLVYLPVTHMAWGADGLMNGVWNPRAAIRAIDFAGGTVVEMASGWSSLVLCLIVGRRMGYGREVFAPHSMVFCMVGAGLLWVGWYGFNAGSAIASDGVASNAFVTTTLAGAVASGTWAFAEYLTRGKASVLGFCSGIVSGLVAITPACGFVNPSGAMVIGILGGLIPFLAVFKLKAWFKYDDSLDVFGIHGVAGTLGMLMTGLLADAAVNPNLLGAAAQANGLAHMVGHGLWIEQLKAMGVTFAIALIGTTVAAYIVKAIMPVRISPEEEHSGMDLAEHGEEGYIL